jgi:predicted transcriptional regulator
MVREFVDRVFNGAAEPLLLHLVEDDQLTKEELDEIRSSIRSEKRRP